LVIKSSWALLEENLGVEQLEFFAVKFRDAITLEKIIESNKNIKTLVV